VNLYSRFREVAGTDRAAVALVVDGKEYSYEELLLAVDRCALGLSERGVAQGDAVGVAFPNSFDFVVAAFAVFALGGILVPLNARFKEEELRHYITQSRPKAVLFPESLGGIIRSLDIPIAVLATGVEEVSADAARAQGASGSLPLEGNALTGLYMFSSGSTGKSKRITRTQTQVFEEYAALSRTIGLEKSDRILCTVPLFHAHGFCNAMLASLLTGGRMVLLTAEFNARASMRALTEQAITLYPAVPFMFKMLAETRFEPKPSLASLRLPFSAGAALSEAVSAKFLEVFGIPISQLYGSTETGAISINVARAKEKPTSVGLPLSGMKLEIHGEEGELLDPGQSGEVWVRSVAATSRYDALPELTAECFRDGGFFAGDMGYLDAEGYLFITGRKKLLINVAGYKVDPLEVEEVLSRHPAVAEVVVVGVGNADVGERAKAVVVLREQSAATPDELIEFSAAHLAEYKVPRFVEFRGEIPKSPLGKILRKYL
jgi:long-chain acyl-CoA synthetase